MNRLARFRWLIVAAAFATVLTDATVATAQIYRWTDAAGDIHYSQGIDSVPPRYRSSAKIIGYERASPPPEPGAAVKTTTGQIKFTPGHPILVTARINDAGSALLMLDTGAARTVINPGVLSALGVSYDNSQRGTLKGVTGDAEVVAVRVDSVDVNGARYGPLMVVSHDTGFGPGRGDGLLGRDFLDHFTVTIDNSAGVLTLAPK
jgi:predicted aspartyl protease